jgi:hypothetical protein
VTGVQTCALPIFNERIQNIEDKIKFLTRETESVTVGVNKPINEHKSEVKEKRLNRSLSTSIDENPEKNPSLPDKYYFPSGLYKFLLAFNQDPVLKSTCHLIDINELEKIKEYCKTTEYNFEKHYLKLLESYEKLEILFAPPYIKALIRGYLTANDFNNQELSTGWSNYNIKWHWGHKTLKEWSIKNKGIPPNPDEGIAEKMDNVGFKIETPVKIKDKYLQSFSDVVIGFKKMFHIRFDNSLFEILKTQNELKKWNDKVDFEIDSLSLPENIELFTDIDKVLQAYDEIVKLIINFQKDEKPKVKLSLTENENSIFFSIHHLNVSQYGKSLSSAKSRLIGADYPSIITKLNGVCNIYLQADFGQNDFAKIAIWDEKWNIQREREINKKLIEFKGVEHILEFKRK